MILIISTFLFIGCESKVKTVEKDTINSEEDLNKDLKIDNVKPLSKYTTVRKMLEAASDFYEENGSLKFISEDNSNIHIQVSKSVLEAESKDLKEEIVKRDIVYVVFQSFAQTNIDKITVTAIPIDQNNRKKYYNRYARTIKIGREKAAKILKKYLGSDNFSLLYEKNGDLWLPSKKFSKLKFEKLNQVFNEMSN
ncbi:MAG: hypothetical protein AB8B65_20555 [Kordia sp.]